MDEEFETVFVCFIFTLICAIICEHDIRKQQRRKRRWSIRPINQKHLKVNFKTLFDEMEDIDEEQFAKYVRMNKNTFLILLKLVQHKITKRQKLERISVRHRLAITLHYLAHGCSMQEVAWNFSVGKTTASVIITETCQAIWDVLSPMYLKPPTVEEWKEKVNEYETLWNLPNCIGSLDGKHIRIQAPKKSGSEFFNYKKTFSIVLMAVCDANYVFTLVDIGAYGSTSDGGVFKESCFGKALDTGEMKLPSDSYLPGTEIKFPHFLAADEAFPLKSYIMRPYPGKNLSEKQRIFNYRLSRGRRTIENAFGILAARWRVFHNDIIADVSTIEKITAAAICLHNFLRTLETEIPTQQRVYCPPSYTDMVLPDGTIHEGDWRKEQLNSWRSIGRSGSNYAARCITKQRDVLADYLKDKGAVSWQRERIFTGTYPREI